MAKSKKKPNHLLFGDVGLFSWLCVKALLPLGVAVVLAQVGPGIISGSPAGGSRLWWAVGYFFSSFFFLLAIVATALSKTGDDGLAGLGERLGFTGFVMFLALLAMRAVG